ncbi:MAG: T9SS type A sorting domain-containing protein [Flavobacteriales bacterium]|nr:T9SS type A sorting domain-containing protein [Flavobacteriales bacterium]
MDSCLVKQVTEVLPETFEAGMVLLPDFHLISSVSLYDVSGQLLSKSQHKDSLIHLKLDGPPGLYFIRIDTPSGNFMRKIVKE